ncbi:DUF305 domain-containing protein [Actinocatenispora thailandica]|uniref:DUF305 domain-containing protein n=1 Tax=Actinocatenispora thailandica TaxID=227318 RepID=A0A7R7I0Z1_9ACTN|nr:DUF305 domain-containing protein [Actinocatenispora thailandica]BCJ38543.1 DUF305 domain-containing protein [Actinocatenispora thailandica]
MRRRGLLVTPGLLVLTGCTTAGTAEPKTSASRYVNAADVRFARQMITANSHSRRITRCADGRPVPSGLRSLAAAIGATERDENKTMTVWLRTWRAAAPDPTTHDPTTPDSATPGRDADVARLTAARDDDFADLFRRTLAAAQQHQLALATAETRHGINVGARDLARRIIRSRTAELDQLR